MSYRDRDRFWQSVNNSPYILNLLDFSDSQRELQELVQKFTRDEIIPVAGEYDKTMKFPWDILKKAHALGLTQATIPEEYGGGGMGVIEACILAENLSYGCSGILTAITGSGLAVCSNSFY